MLGIRNMVTMTIALAGIASFVGAGGIDQRPDIINNKERFGDWEIDTIVGAFNKGAIVTLTERTTKMLLMKYLPNGKEAKGLAKAVIDLLICYLFLYLWGKSIIFAPVKFLAYIFSIYFLALMIMPCSDVCAYPSADTTYHMATSKEHSSDTSDACSPFCLCNCCHSSEVTSPIFLVYEICVQQPLTEKVCPLYHSPLHSDYFISIWQPPKINV